MTLLRAWLIGTSIIISALAIWAFAPVLVFLALLAAALGLLSAVMIALVAIHALCNAFVDYQGHVMGAMMESDIGKYGALVKAAGARID